MAVATADTPVNLNHTAKAAVTGDEMVFCHKVSNWCFRLVEDESKMEQEGRLIVVNFCSEMMVAMAFMVSSLYDGVVHIV
ncbi:hypothetical protein CsSME_00032712 [Camellia sinensis var. sinensis]